MPCRACRLRVRWLPPVRRQPRGHREPARGCRRRGLPCGQRTRLALPGPPPVEGKSVAVATRSTTTRPPAAAGGYTARHLQVLEGLEAVRKRPGMYIGSTDSRGLMHCLWEIIDNAVDEALAGECDRIDVVLLRRRVGRGARQRSRHPGRRRAPHRPVRRRGRLHQAARRRQVRRRLLHRQRRPARRRRLGRQRPVRPPRGRGRPRRQDLRDELPPGRAGRLRRRRGHQGHALAGRRVHRRTSRTASCGSSARPRAARTGSRIRYWADQQIFLKDRRPSPTTTCSPGRGRPPT